MTAGILGVMLSWGLQIVAAGILCFVPLFDVLSYEFCWAMGLVTAVTAPFVGLAAAQKADRPAAAVFRALRQAVGHILLPLALICVNAMRVQNCNWTQGLWFWLLLPLCSALYGASLGMAIGRFGLQMGALCCRVLVTVAIVTPLGLSLWTLYAQPPITAFDHLWGYFAGSLYDEAIGIDLRLVSFRLGTLLRVVGLGAGVVAWERWPRLGTATVLSTVVFSAGVPFAYEHWVGPMMGFGVTRDAILAHLPITITRPNLVIHLPEGTSQALQARIADDHAYRLDALLQRLDICEPRTLHSYVYPSAEDKAMWMGGRHTMVAKPWLGEIHIHDVLAPHPVMPHELAHAVAAGFGSRWLGVSAAYELWVHMGLVEGLAQALSPDEDSLDLHHWAHALTVLGLAPEMRQILGPQGFWTQAPRRAYTIAGSFVRYLLETQGPGALKLVYPHADFEDVYKRPLDALVQEWEAHIAKLATTVQDNHVAADRYFTPSIFTRTCAHEIARLQQLAEQSPPMRAVALRREVVEHLGGAAQARAALAEAKLAAGDLSGFVSDADALLASKNLSFAAQAHLEELASFALWQAGRQQEAQERAQRVLDLNVGDGPSRLAWVRLWAMSQDTEAQSALMAYTSGSLSPVAACVYLARATAANPDAPTYPYLLGRQLFAAQAWAEAVAPLNQAVHHPFALISEEASRMLATSLSELGRSTEAQAVWQRLATTSQRSGIVAQAKDGLARLDWAQAHAAAPTPDATH